jgi:hypothetical protein
MIESKDDIVGEGFRHRTGADRAAMLSSGRAQATLHHERLVARGTYRASVMGNHPLDATWFLRGQDHPHRGRHDRRALATRTVT